VEKTGWSMRRHSLKKTGILKEWFQITGSNGHFSSKEGLNTERIYGVVFRKGGPGLTMKREDSGREQKTKAAR